MKHQPEKYVADVLQSIVQIESFVAECHSFREFEKNILVKKAVERNLEIIGEAIHHLSKMNVGHTITNARKIVDMRNVLIHDYDVIEDVVVWGVVVKHLPLLKREVTALHDTLSRMNT
jgi:uncharacterized protein with HEPN domain